MTKDTRNVRERLGARDIPQRASVLIVGGGPCGLTLAIELGRRGVDAVLVDAKLDTAIHPQANATQARTMEHFRRLGFADEVRSLGLPRDYPTDIAYFTRYGGIELARLCLPSAERVVDMTRELKGSWSAAELPHRVSQKFVERILRREAAAQASVSLHYGWKLMDFSAHDEGVAARLENVQTGDWRTFDARYMIGVDGARSTVRRCLGIRYVGKSEVVRDFFGGQMVAAHLRVPDFYRTIPHDRAWMYWAVNKARRSWLAAVNGIDEFAFHTQLKPGEDASDVSHRHARILFSEVTAVALDVQVLAVGTWVAGYSLVAESFGSERVFIGGDAAHLFTPAGGLGYNTAVEDAVNLGWKLAAAIRGTAGPGLLASYTYERRKLAVRNTEYAAQLAESIGTFVPSAALESDTPEGATARVFAGRFLKSHALREFDIPGISFGGRYDGSSAIIPDAVALPRDEANIYIPSASPGGRPPHFWLLDGRSLFDLFGPEWTLLQLGGSGTHAEQFTGAARKRGIHLKTVRVDSPEVRSLYGADLVLVRPDQIVAWRGGGAQFDCERVFSRLMGHSVSFSARDFAG